jgi:importin subunit beta-1
MNPELKAAVKQRVLRSLSSAVREVSAISAQVVSKIACIELPRGEWPDLVATLMSNVMNPDPRVREASLKSIGYVCEEVTNLQFEGTEVTIDTNSVLTSIVQGMNKSEPSEEVKLAATKALHNSLHLVDANFQNQAERDFIMTVICEAMVQVSENIRVAAYECMATVAELYYDYLEAYMPALFELTLGAIKGVNDAVAMQAIEFWSNIAKTERDILSEDPDAEGARKCMRYTLGVTPHILPLLLVTLTRQEDEEPEEDAWDLAHSAATCISEMAVVVEAEIVPQVMAFVQENIQDASNWRKREAAITAFGAILEGPDPDTLAPLVVQGASVLIARISDPHPYVKDTAVWALARICELFPVKVVSEMLEPVLTALVARAQDTPRIATSACWGLYNIFGAFEVDAGHPNVTNQLSAPFSSLVTTVLYVSERPDNSGGSNKLRSSAFETLSALVRAAALDCTDVVRKLVGYMLDRAQKSFSLATSHKGGQEDQMAIQADLSGVLAMLTIKLERDILPYANSLMQLYMAIFQSSGAVEETITAVGVLARAAKADFLPYVADFMKVLIAALGNVQSSQVCLCAVRVLQDLCHAELGKNLLPYSDGLVSVLLENLRNPAVQQDIRAPIISSFGDICIAIGGHFEKYFPFVMSMLAQASSTTVDMSDPDLAAYICELRGAIFSAYSAILMGLSDDKKQDLMVPHALAILDFAAGVGNESMHDDELVGLVLSTIGDIAKFIGRSLPKDSFRRNQGIAVFISKCKVSEDSSVRQTCNWTVKRISEI